MSLSPQRASDPTLELGPAPRISIVMPVYNAERLLGECLAALRASTWRDFEIIVVDDSSTDGSREIAAAHGARVVPSGGRLGPGRARNKGAETARGDIVFFIDSDVVVRPDTLAKLVAAFERDPKLDGVIAVQSPTMRFRNLCSVYKNLWMYYTYVRRAGEDVPLFYTTAAGIRRAAFVASGGFDVNYTNPNIEDTDYGQKLARMGFRIQVLPDLEVEHVKGYDLAGLLRVDFLRSMSLARLKLRKSADGIGTNDTSVPTGYILSVPLAGLAMVALLLGLLLGNRALLIANFLALAVVLVLNVPFLSLIRAHGGMRAWGLSCGLLIVELLAAGAGSAVGIATYLSGKKY
jgi:glycosyltransferase involved in cell wall biosynthesis